MSREPISVLLADEHTLYREALALSLAHASSITVAGQCGNGPEARQLFHTLQPDILLVDITVRAERGFATTHQVLTEYPDAKVIWISTFFVEAYSRRISEAGTRGYLTKSMSYLDIVEAIHKVKAGEIFIGDKIQQD